MTLDTIMCDLVHDLLRAGLLSWPNGHTTLSVVDSWASFSGSTWNRTTYRVVVVGDQIEVKQGWVANSDPRSRRRSLFLSFSKELVPTTTFVAFSSRPLRIRRSLPSSVSGYSKYAIARSR